MKSNIKDVMTAKEIERGAWEASEDVCCNFGEEKRPASRGNGRASNTEI